jgi:hypothetical protein
MSTDTIHDINDIKDLTLKERKPVLLRMTKNYTLWEVYAWLVYLFA